MKDLKKYLLVAAAFFLSFVLAGCVEAASLAEQNIMERIETTEEPVIRWGVKADTNLFGFYNIAEQQIDGFDIDIAKAVTDIITDGEGTAEVIEVSSKTRIPLLKNGNIDAIIATMTISEERAQVVDFSQIYFDAGQSLLVHEDSDITGVDSLTSDHTVIAIKGATSGDNVRQMAPEANVIELDNYSEGFLALQSGQGDALTTDNAILLGMIDQNPDYRLAGENFTVEPYGIAVNQGQEDFLNAVNAALDQLQEDGTYDEIYEKWFGGLM